MDEVTPRSRRAKASTPTTINTIAAAATSPSDGQSNWLASGTFCEAQENQESQATEEKAGTAPW